MRWRETLTQRPVSARVLRLLETLFETPVITIPQAQRALGSDYPGAKRAIDKLVAAGILEQASPSSYGKVYVAREILAAVDTLRSGASD